MERSVTEWIVFVVVLAILGGVWVSRLPSGEEDQERSEMVRVVEPREGAVVNSPLVVRGEARGNWYFEASFPLRLEDAAGMVVASGIATAQGEWMTESFVSFEATLTWQKTPQTETGTLILQRDNPSGLPEYDEEIRVPIRF